METAPTTIILDPNAWVDAPQAVIGQMTAHVLDGIVIDASGAGRVPAQVAQVLLAGFESAQAAAAAFRINNPTAEVVDSLQLLGLSHILVGASDDS